MERDALIKFILDNYNAGEVLAYDLWNVNDIQERASELEENPNLTKEEAEAVLYAMTEDKDCNNGFDNEFVYNKIDEVVDERE